MPKTKRKDVEKLWDRVRGYRAKFPDPVPINQRELADLYDFAESLGLRATYIPAAGSFAIYLGPGPNAIQLEKTYSASGVFSFLLGFRAAVDSAEWRGGQT